jgi:transposase
MAWLINKDEVKLFYAALFRSCDTSCSERFESPKAESIEYLGIDEKNFKGAHHYATVLNDQEQGRVLDVVGHRPTEASKQVLESLNHQQRTKVKTVSVDSVETLCQRGSSAFAEGRYGE